MNMNALIDLIVLIALVDVHRLIDLKYLVDMIDRIMGARDASTLRNLQIRFIRDTLMHNYRLTKYKFKTNKTFFQGSQDFAK